jgi:transmembrane sensor
MNMLDAKNLRSAAEASEWLVRLREEPNSEDLLNEWLRWREAEPANAAAYDRMCNLWHQFDQANPEEKDTERNSNQVNTRSPRKRWRAGIAALAAGCAAVACAVWLAAPRQDYSNPPTAARENRSSVLPDGTAVVLGARTSVAVNFSPKTRLLQLSHGEAFFKVKADPTRPFTVRAGSLDVTAVGTAFDVNHQESRIVVTVQEGLVAIKPTAALRGTAAASWRVGSGSQFVYSEVDATATLSAVDTSAALAWREGRLEYTRAPLSAVIADVNRYSEHRVELEDPRVGALTFTGTVFTDSISDWVSALPGALPLIIDRRENGSVVLRASEVAR